MEDQEKDQKTEKELEAATEEIGEKISKKIEDYFESASFKYLAEGFFGAFFTILGTVLMVAFWDDIALFNDDFTKMMDIIYISLVLNVGMYILLIVIRSDWAKMLRDIVSNMLSLAFFVILLNVYPFAFGGNWDILENIMKPMIYIIMALVVLATIVETAKYLGKIAGQSVANEL